MLAPDYPAAHSMDTQWFCVDAQGRVAMFDTCLRELYVPEDLASAAARSNAERPERVETFEQAVARRLAELRALLELTEVLHAAGKPLSTRAKST